MSIHSVSPGDILIKVTGIVAAPGQRPCSFVPVDFGENGTLIPRKERMLSLFRMRLGSAAHKGQSPAEVVTVSSRAIYGDTSCTDDWPSLKNQSRLSLQLGLALLRKALLPQRLLLNLPHGVPRHLFQNMQLLGQLIRSKLTPEISPQILNG